MARGPFQGTFQPNLRPTVVTAPDAIVFINGEMAIPGCPQCSRHFDFNKYITSIQIDLSVDSAPGSASLALSVPRHSIDDFFFDGNPVITPMMEVEIYAKGYYLVEGLPQYYPIFWGLVTEVGDSYSGGEHTVSIHCADILKWWELCRMNINPAYTAPSGQQGRSIFGNVFFGMNPYDVIWSLALQSFGDVVIGTGSLISSYKEQNQKATFDAALSDIMLYWEQRFQRIRSNLVMYGINGVAVRGDTLNQAYSRRAKGPVSAAPLASPLVRNANGGSDAVQMVFDPTAANVTAFRTQFSQAGQINFWQSEYQTKLELANAAKEAIGFEFFMDPSGDIVFKPPFYNLDVLSNKPVSWIQDIDVIDWDLSESEAEVVTQLTMQGSFGGNIDYSMPEEVTPFTSVTDYHLLRKYGWRPQSFNSEFLGNEQLMFYHGMDILDRLNSRRHRATVTIPMRPELRLGFPVYLAPKDQVWYLTGISHNIAFGGRATTTLTLAAKRTKFIAPRGTGTLTLTSMAGGKPPSATSKAAKAKANLSFKYTSNELSERGVFDLNLSNVAYLPGTSTSAAAGMDNPYEPMVLRHPKTGRIVGYPNVVMVYTRPFAPGNADLNTIKGEKQPGTNASVSKLNNQALTNFANKDFADIDKQVKDEQFNRLKEKYATNRYQYGLNSAGVYCYAHDASDDGAGVIGEILLMPTANINVKPVPQDPKLKALRGKTTMIRPVSDERGFEVIGHFRYGRRVALRDGRLVMTDGVNSPANIDMQFALAGGLFETLNAQSQGLTAIASAYANPSDAIARMQPEDTQTAAVVNPDGTPGPFIDVGDNFVDTAPLGSPEQQGAVASVEASQLSRALTLAEMSINQTDQLTDDDDCVCLTGRSDLAFINVGYQVKSLNQASADTSSLFRQGDQFNTASPQDPNTFSNPVAARAIAEGQPLASGSTDSLSIQAGNIQKQIDALQSRLADTQTGVEATIIASANLDPYQIADQKQKSTDIQNQIDALQQQLATVNQQIKDTQSSTLMPSSKTFQSRVEMFLANLYKALDTPHQQFEGALRGDYMPGGLLTKHPDDISSLPGEPPPLAPPFSPANRAALGDPNAQAGAMDSAVNNLTSTWNSFGAQLKASAQRAQVTQDLSNAQSQLARFQQQRMQLATEAANNNTSYVVPSPADQIAALDKQIAQLEQQIANDQATLNQLQG